MVEAIKANDIKAHKNRDEMHFFFKTAMGFQKKVRILWNNSLISYTLPEIRASALKEAPNEHLWAGCLLNDIKWRKRTSGAIMWLIDWNSQIVGILTLITFRGTHNT